MKLKITVALIVVLLCGLLPSTQPLGQRITVDGMFVWANRL